MATRVCVCVIENVWVPKRTPRVLAFNSCNNNNKNCCRRTTSNENETRAGKKIIFHYRMILARWRCYLECTPHTRINVNRISIWSPLHSVRIDAHIYYCFSRARARAHNLHLSNQISQRRLDTLHTWLQPKILINNKLIIKRTGMYRTKRFRSHGRSSFNPGPVVHLTVPNSSRLALPACILAAEMCIRSNHGMYPPKQKLFVRPIFVRLRGCARGTNYRANRK